MWWVFHNFPDNALIQNKSVREGISIYFRGWMAMNAAIYSPESSDSTADE